jgi:hypothetical protein
VGPTVISNLQPGNLLAYEFVTGPIFSPFSLPFSLRSLPPFAQKFAYIYPIFPSIIDAKSPNFCAARLRKFLAGDPIYNHHCWSSEVDVADESDHPCPSFLF